jgi:hypothetical protein
MRAAHRLMLESPNQSMAFGPLAVPSTLLIKPSLRAYISCQMIPTSAKESITGVKKIL